MKKKREPRQRKGESWSTYLLRWEFWYKDHGRFGYGQFYRPPEVLAGHYQPAYGHIPASSIAHIVTHYKAAPVVETKSDVSDMHQVAKSVWCNDMGLRFLEESQKKANPKLVAPEDDPAAQECVYVASECSYPGRNRGTSAGQVSATIKYGSHQIGLWETIPDSKLNLHPCCVEGAFLLTRKLKAEGWSNVTFVLDERPEMVNEYEILFGQKPCWDK